MEKERKKTFVVVLNVVLFLSSLSLAQFPRKCTDTRSLSMRECCPFANDGSQCGEDSKRGVCNDVPLLFANLTLNESFSLLLDDRAWWPRAFFDRVCKCSGNFDGVDCSQCKPGFEGKNCEVKSLLKIRKNVMQMTFNEIINLIKIVDNSKLVISENYVILTTSFDKILNGESPVFRNASIYDLFVWMHYYVTRDNLLFPNELINRVDLIDSSCYSFFQARGLSKLESDSLSVQLNRMQLAAELLAENPPLFLGDDVDYAHEGPSFLPWHRYFMLKWEIEIRENVAMDPNFVLPYWDWRDLTSCNICNDLMFGDQSLQNQSLLSASSIFSQWRSVCTKGNDYMLEGGQCDGEAEDLIERNPGNFDPTKITGLPTSNEIINMYQFGTDYDTPGYDKTANMSHRNILEGFANPDTGITDPERSFVHNAVHLFMNGTMSSVETSANDPIFIVHHVFVDSLFELWLRDQQVLGRNGFFQDREGPRLGHRMQDDMVPFFPLVKNRDGFVDSKSLGYDYDYFNGDATTMFADAGSTFVESSGVDNSPLFQFKVNEKYSFNFPNLTSRTGIHNVVANQLTNAHRYLSKIKTKSKFHNRYHRWHRPRYSEGETPVPNNGNNHRPSFAVEQQFAITAEESDSSSILSDAWVSLKQGFDDVNQVFRNLSREETAWLVIACGLVISFVITCVCMCRSSSHLHKGGRSSCCCCCCRSYQGEEEEYYALLDTNSSKVKVITNGDKP